MEVPEAPVDDTHRVAEATPEEIEAAKARQMEREEQGFHDQLWLEATRKALVDPERPLCARELVKENRLTAWWSLPWKDARTQIDGTLVDEYRELLRSYFVEPDAGPGTVPEAILERCACIFAYFKQNGRPVFESEGRAIEASIFKVPGQKVVSFPTTIHGPSYKEPKTLGTSQKGSFPLMVSVGAAAAMSSPRAPSGPPSLKWRHVPKGKT